MKNKILKKGLAALLTIAMVLGLTPESGFWNVISGNETVYAQETHNSHDGWTDLNSVSGGSNGVYEITEAGKYYLSDNMTSNESKYLISVSGDIDVTLCLNGHTITSGSKAAIYTGGNAKLTITDCNENRGSIESAADWTIYHSSKKVLTLHKVKVKATAGIAVRVASIGTGGLILNDANVEAKSYAIQEDSNGNLTITDSVLTTSGSSTIFMPSNVNIESITISGSTFNGKVSISGNCTDCNISESNFNAIYDCFSINGGNVKVMNCHFKNTYSKSGYGLYIRAQSESENSLTVTGGSFTNYYSTLRLEGDTKSLDCTLSDDISFSSNMYDLKAAGTLNMHLNGLETTNAISLYVDDSESSRPTIICDAENDNLRFIHTKYIINKESYGNDKYLLTMTERAITTQPNSTSPTVEVNDEENASYQWCEATETTKTLKDTASEDAIVPEDIDCGKYEDGVWKPTEYSSDYFAYGWYIPFSGNGTLVLENKDASSTLEDYVEDVFYISDDTGYSTATVKGGKLYFNVNATDEFWFEGYGVPETMELVITLISTNDVELEGHIDSSIGTVEKDGTYRCHVTWNKDTAFAYSAVSDIIEAKATVGAPTANPTAGTYSENQSVTLTSSTEGATIYYTTDGSEPTLTDGEPSGTTVKYTAPIAVTGTEGQSVTTTIKAIAVKDGLPNSYLQTFSYTINLPTPTPGPTPTPTPDPTPNPTPTEDYTIPVKNENTAEVKAEIKDGTANVSEITTDTIEKVINNKDAESKVDTITIDLSGAKQEVTGVTLSKKSVETLAKTTAEKDNGIETATIELSKATVVLDNKTLETLVEQAKGSQIELVVADTEQKKLNTAQQTALNDYQVATSFEAYFTSDGERIHDFNGGTAAVSIDFTPEAGKDTSYYHLVYVADDGKLTRYKTKYQGGRLMFTTTHFSDYAVIYDTSEKNETDAADGDDGTGANVTLDTTYRKLRLRVPTTTKTTNVLKWNRVADADGYVIYGNQCNTKDQTYKMVQQVVIKDNAITTWTDKNLAGGTYYKYCIKAYKLVDGKKVWLAKSKVVHSTTVGGKYGNAKSVKVNKIAVSLAVGKTFTIKAEQIVKDLPIKKHVDIKYESSNSKVASVTSNGVIKAKGKGTCYIYVYAQNGMYKRVKVTVK